MTKLSFTHIYADCKFIVEFDSESIERNLLQTVSFEGFNLDVPDLRSTHPKLYAGIKNEMSRVSEEYWRPVNKEILDIPTLAYQKRPIHNFGTWAIAFFFMLISFGSFAQPFVSFEGQTRGFGMNAGYVFKNVEAGIGYQMPMSRKAAIPYTYYVSVGYNILRSDEFIIVPALGYSRYHEEPVKGALIDKGALFSGIDVGKNFTTVSSHDGRYYVFARHSVRMFVGAGLKVFID